jgi:thiol-disulfide isomerase/thioredoxin
MLSSRDGTGKDSVNGMLAGYTLDRWRTPMAETTIEIVDLNEPPSGGKRARISTTSDRNGQYKFEGLNPSHQYQLVARSRDGNRGLVGQALATPPNPRLPIFLTEDFSGSDPRSAAKDKEDDKGTDKTSARDRTNSIGSPAATIAPPVKDGFDAAPTPTNSLPAPGPAPKPEDDRSRSIRDGFIRDPIINIPGPAPGTPPAVVPPPPPSAPSTPAATSPMSPAPSPGMRANFGMPEGPSPELPTAATTVPSCTLVGKRLSNFALYDNRMQPWVYSRDRNPNTRLVLLDFWFTTCKPCREAIPILREFQRTYGPHGLQVVSIANEGTPLKEAADAITGARGRLNINYTTLLAGGGEGTCPVVTQFGVERFPTLVVLDESGTIIWRKVGGFDEQSRLELDLLIRKKLGLRPQ